MKKIVFILLLLIPSRLFCQNIEIIKSFERAKNDSVKIDILKTFYDRWNFKSPDSMKYYYSSFNEISQKQNDQVAEAVNMGEMGLYIFLCGEVPQGLQLVTLALHKIEPTNNARALGMITFALQYFTKDNNRRISLIRKALAFSKQADDKLFLTYEYRNLGHINLSLKLPDSAFYYYQTAYNMSLKTKASSDIILNLIGLGNTNYLVGNKKISLQYYKDATEIETDNVAAKISPYNALATFFQKEKNTDSCIYFAKKSYDLSNSTSSPFLITQSTVILKDIYTRLNSDSALKYTNIYYTAMDSMYGRKSIEQIQALNFAEEIRQQKVEEEKLKAQEERKNNLQNVAILLGLITLIVLFLLLSHSIIANQKSIRFFGVVALLIVFEFLNLLLHPFLQKITHHSPVLMLLALVCIAALLVPMHHKVEKWVTAKLVEKNKQIRLAAAKKTIKELETKPDDL